ncbi:MAG: hypothetical protein ACW98K_07655 [Candidatus Kariarchaeaceae archaeon]|jgi:phage shock protein PspC (stress-responsive transcriptional regulator)
MKLKRIFSTAVMSFFLGFLFYLVAAAIMDSLPQLVLSANIRGGDVDIVTDIIRPFIGIPAPLTVWNIQDTIAVIIIWILAGVIGGFAGKDKFEGALGTFLAFFTATSISIFLGTPVIGTDPINANVLETMISRVSNLVFTEELLRILIFSTVAFLSGLYFGYLGKKDASKAKKFWTELDERSNKIQLAFECSGCHAEFESNPLYCSTCGLKLREEVIAPST